MASRHGILSCDAAQGALVLLALSLTMFTYERALIPIYASGPTTYLMNKITLATVFASSVVPITASMWKRYLCAAVLLSAAPNATHWVAILSSRRKDPVLGPTVTHVLVLVPVVFSIMSCLFGLNLKRVLGAVNLSPLYLRLSSAALTYTFTTQISQKLWPGVLYLNEVSGSTIFLGLAGLYYVASIYSVQPSRVAKKSSPSTLFSFWDQRNVAAVAFLAFWWAVHPNLASPVLPHPLEEPYTHPTFPLRILSSVQSTTGLIVVGDALPPPDYDGKDDEQMHSVRYLRASHSILGGVWTGAKVMSIDGVPPLVDSHGEKLGDSIYSTFVLQEAVCLINSTAKGKAGKLDNALIIGLGTGISATAFQRHKISTTIVEIDPAVYDAARKYFALPDPGPGQVFLEDARGWVAAHKNTIGTGGGKEFDFIVHDCFSGGGVPQHIFTIEFWEDLKALLTPEGIVVVNFAGIVKSDASRMVIFTLMKTFPQCRAFHDLVGDLSLEQYDTDFINMVIFCTRSNVPMTFRNSRKQDYLGSPLRRHVFQSLSKRELRLDLLRDSEHQDDAKYILTDAHNPLGKLQDAQGHHHWSLMREVLPDIYWEVY